MRALFLVCAIGLAVVGFGQVYKDSDRFGKTSMEVAAMGRAGWIGWYCDSTRAGATGNVEGVKIFAMALYDRNKATLVSKSEAEQKFFDEVWIQYANLAKSSFTVGTVAYPNWEVWSLAVAQSSLSINQLISDLLEGRKARRKVEPREIQSAYLAGKDLLDAAPGRKDEYVKTEYGRSKWILEQVEKLFSPRTSRERYLARQLCLEMIHLASDKRA